MVSSPMDEEWELLANFLPSNWRELARETKAMRRARGEIATADALLRVLLMHVATGLSLKQAAARAHVQGIASVSDVALLKRLRSSEVWLRELAREMFESSRFVRATARAPKGYRLRAIDATTVEEPGATGTDWRVHYSICLPEMRCDFYSVTDSHTAEAFNHFPIHKGDLVLADRGYCHRKAVAAVMQQDGDVIVRLNSTGFPLLNASGATPFDFLRNLRRLKGHKPGEWAVRFEANGKMWSARLCAVRKSEAAADRAKKKLRNMASKRQYKLQEETLEFAEYIFVLVTVGRDIIDTGEVLELYRARWQIELCFKRLKSLLKLGHVPKRNDASARAWIQGKLLTALLVEKLVREARFFSPWGFEFSSTEPLARIHRSA